MERIKLTSRLYNTEYYDRSRDIETALAWSAIKKTLHEAGRDDLFSYIKSIRISGKETLKITTQKPMVNQELQFMLRHDHTESPPKHDDPLARYSKIVFL